MPFWKLLILWLKKILNLEVKDNGEEEEYPKIESCGTISLSEMASVIYNKLDDINDDEAEVYLPDSFCKIYRKNDVKEYLGLDEISEIVFVTEEMDCDDFAAELFGKFAGLVWTNRHALNWFIDENSKLWFIEPQTDKISENLENWQGWDIRFFLGR